MENPISFFCSKGEIPLSEYVRECLYNPDFGYYAKKSKLRVGGLGDFYTSSSVSPEVFGNLLFESAKTIAGKNFEKCGDFKIYEIGAEPKAELFKNSNVIRVFDKLEISGKSFVFSNELLDAQPFDRFVFDGGKIFKTFVKFTECGKCETSLRACEEFERDFLLKNFSEIRPPFTLDFSFKALELLREICTQNWSGVLIFADYFRLKGEILEFPKGTARIYKKHRANADIFLAPSECDITFSPTVEVFAGELSELGLREVKFASQGAFFMDFAQSYIREIVEREGPLSPKKRALAELLTPANMGEMFRVLSAVKF